MAPRPPSIGPKSDKREDVQAAELDLADDLARYPDLRFALEYWTGKCRGRFAPSRADIDPAEIVSILPRVMLADVEHDGGCLGRLRPYLVPV